MNLNLSQLSEREEIVLESVVQQFVITGDPVGSRTISKKSNMEISAATIRNVMADLEEKGFLDHPHTSAGRIPTSKGYRHYVDNLLRLAKLTKAEQSLIIENIIDKNTEINLILDKTAKILASLSNHLGVILSPGFYEAILEKIDLAQISSSRLLVVLNLKNNPARTVLLEISHKIDRKKLDQITMILNERIGGLPLREIRETFRQRVSDIRKDESGLIRLFIESADKLFDFQKYTDIKYTGTRNILTTPEFSNVEKFSAFVELLEDKNIIIHMMENLKSQNELQVIIGEENKEKIIQDCSIVTAPYKWGDVNGVLGVIGPMRMAYRKVIPLVDFTAKIITKMFQEK